MKDLIDKSPKSAMALYVKIYCGKQGKTKNRQYTLIEATKSWVSLSKTERQYFYNVFKEYKTKMKKYFAANLQNAQLYMKKKHDHKRLCPNKSMSSNQFAHEDTAITVNSESICYDKDKHEIENDDNKQLDQTTTLTPESPICDELEPDVPRLMPEPTPPVSSSMDLFEIIKHSEESTQNLDWAQLTKLQKQRYQRALLKIKNDYIKQYTAYLEQLPPKDLFYHYKSKLT